MRKKPSKRGPARMRELGFTPVTCWFSAEELANVDSARGGYTKRATYVHQAAALAAARRVFEKQKA